MSFTRHRDRSHGLATRRQRMRYSLKCPVAMPFVIWLAACGGASGGPAADGRQASVVGQNAPDLKLTSLGAEARTVSLRDFRGRVILLDIWASWCGPCREELPLLDDMAARLMEKGVRVVAVSVDDNRDDAKAFLRSRPKWSITFANDPEGRGLGILQPPKMPSSYIVDGEGVVREVIAGFSRDDASKVEARLVELAR